MGCVIRVSSIPKKKIFGFLGVTLTDRQVTGSELTKVDRSNPLSLSKRLPRNIMLDSLDQKFCTKQSNYKVKYSILYLKLCKSICLDTAAAISMLVLILNGWQTDPPKNAPGRGGQGSSNRPQSFERSANQPYTAQTQLGEWLAASIQDDSKPQKW